MASETVGLNREFEAHTECPQCKNINVHWLRPADPTVEDSELTETVTLRSWGGWSTTVKRKQSVNEATAEVVRECRGCGHNWLEGNRAVKALTLHRK